VNADLCVKMVKVNSRVFMQAAFGKHHGHVPRFVIEGSFRSRPTQTTRPATAFTAISMRHFLHVLKSQGTLINMHRVVLKGNAKDGIVQQSRTKCAAEGPE
jgi:hypothetical protein